MTHGFDTVFGTKRGTGAAATASQRALTLGVDSHALASKNPLPRSAPLPESPKSLKERYVRGDITVEELESRVELALRHPYYGEDYDLTTTEYAFVNMFRPR
jgi:hypothetical protein